MDNTAQNSDQSGSLPPNPTNPGSVNPPAPAQTQEPAIATTETLDNPKKDVLMSFGTPPPEPLSNPLTPPEATTPVTFTQTVETPKKSKKLVKVFMVLFTFIIVLLVVCAGIVSYAIAYEKLDIPKYPKLKATITGAVMAIPFMPKTPKYLIAKTLIAHEKVTKHDYNISMSLESPSFTSIAGMSRIDIETKGAVDYQNPDDIKFTMDASVTKDFNIELRKPDKMLYFKINKVPSFLFAILGIQSSQLDPVMNKWVSYDTTPLETEASKELKKDTEVKNLSEEFMTDIEDKYLTDLIVKKLKIEKVSEDSNNFYKLSLDFDEETLDQIEKSIKEEKGSTLYSGSMETAKLSDVVKKMNWSFYINTKTYLTHKVSVTSEMEVDKISPSYGSAFLGTGDAMVTQNSTVNFAFVVKFDKFGEEIKVEVPTEVMTFEEFSNTFSQIMLTVYGSVMNPQLNQANDTKRKSDLSSLRIVLEIYKVDCGSYPTALNELVTPPTTCANGKSLLLEVPKDPSGSEYYYKPKTVDGYDLCANLETATETSTTCPDPSYNYHVSFP